MNPLNRDRFVRLASLALTALLCAGGARADLNPDWIARLPVGTALAAGIASTTGDAAGVTYVTGTTGGSTGYTDVVTAAFGPDGALLWSRTFDGPVHWHDQGHAIALGPGGIVWVAGNTPGPDKFAQVLLLAYDATSGAQLQAIQWSSGPGTSEYGASLVVDAQGDVFLGGGTVGDGTDALILKFSASGQFLWEWVWDGPAWSPYSGDSIQQLEFSPTGELIALIHGGMASLKPDYVIAKLEPSTGDLIYMANWGSNGWEEPTEMEIDASGDIYVTGTSISADQYYTIKVRGTNGALLWQAYDSGGVHNGAMALALDAAGGVYVTGIADPDLDESNSNDNYYTVKRDGATGALLWTHHYGLNCLYCFDGPRDVAVDLEGHVFVAGTTLSPPYSADVLTLVLSASTGIETDRGAVSGGLNEYAESWFLRFNAEFDLFNAGEMYNMNTGALDISVIKYTSQLDGSGPTVYCSAKTSSASCVATISTSNLDAQPTSGANDYYVMAWMVQEQKLGLLFGGTTGAANLPFNGGTLCVNSPLTRGPAIPSGGSAPNNCGGSFSTLVNDGQLFPFGLDPGPGQSAWYQYWFRDPNNGPGSLGTSLSNALRLDFQ